MSSDELTVAFARVYQAIVNQTELPSSELPAPGLISPAPRRRGGVVAVAVAIAVVVGVGGVALLRQDSPVSQQDSVERVALVEPPGELGSPLTVVNSSVSTEALEVAPTVDMWRWEAGNSSTDWVALLETDPEADLTALLGPTEDEDTLTATDGQVVSAVLVDTGWSARSWLDGRSWRIAIGYDESAVAEVAQETAGGEPSQASLDGFSLVYQGPQTLYPRTNTELSELFYRTPSGGFSLALFRGWADGTVATRLRSPQTELTDVNGADAVIAGDEINWWISWAIDDQSTAMVQSSDLGPDILKAIARAVSPVSIAQWDEIAPNDSQPTTIN
jgi:hypothetical protein